MSSIASPTRLTPLFDRICNGGSQRPLPDAEIALEIALENWQAAGRSRRSDELYVFSEGSKYERASATEMQMHPQRIENCIEFYRDQYLADNTAGRRNAIESRLIDKLLPDNYHVLPLRGQRGVYAVQDIPANCVLGMYAGVLLDAEALGVNSRDHEAEMRYLRRHDADVTASELARYAFRLPLDGGPDCPDYLSLSALQRGNLLSLMNAAREEDHTEANVGVAIVRMGAHAPIVLFTALANIPKDHQCLFDYGPLYFNSDSRCSSVATNKSAAITVEHRIEATNSARVTIFGPNRNDDGNCAQLMQANAVVDFIPPALPSNAASSTSEDRAETSMLSRQAVQSSVTARSSDRPIVTAPTAGAPNSWRPIPRASGGRSSVTLARVPPKRTSGGSAKGFRSVLTNRQQQRDGKAHLPPQSRRKANTPKRRKHLIRCQQCSRRRPFRDRPLLRRHQLTHTGDRGFACSRNNCGLSFARKDNLITHILFVHDNVRPFFCPVCGRSFATSFNLRKHCNSRGHYCIDHIDRL